MQNRTSTSAALTETAPSASIDHSVAIVTAYVGKNPVQAENLPKLIADIHKAVVELHTGAAAVAAPEVKNPAVPIRKSITPDGIICLEDGKKFKSLKRHLASTFNLTPAAYREKWGLPSDYPMVSPNYSAQRSALAKTIGLGRKPAHH